MSLRTISCASATLLALAIGTAVAAPTPTDPSKSLDPAQALLSLPDAKILLGTASKLQPKLTLAAKAVKLSVPPEQVASPFTLSARRPYDASRGHLTAAFMNLLAANDQISAITDPGNAYVVVTLTNLQANKRILAECSVGAGSRSGTATLSATGTTAKQSISQGQNGTAVLLFTPTTTTQKLSLTFSGGPWGFYGCTFTPQK